MEPILGGVMLRARASLGGNSFGMQVLQLPSSGGDFYPNHNHEESGQEEIYVVLNGEADFQIESETEPVHVGPDTAIRVGAATRRKILPGPDGVRMLVLGGTPGQAYAPPEFTELGGPDPAAPPSAAG